MRELDRLLGWYLELRYGSASNAEQAAFVTLLEQADVDLWDWLNGRAVPPDPGWRRIVDEIRTGYRV
jgi:antitoxin CptB